MRVPTLSIYHNSRYYLNESVSQYNDTQKVVLTEKTVNTASDDPVAAEQILGIESSLSFLDQLSKNLNAGDVWLDSGETALNSLQECILDAKDIALTMSNDHYNEDDLQGAADAVHQILLTTLDIGNTQINGQYLFSGMKTDTPAYEFDTSTNPPRVAYQGDDGSFRIQTGKSAQMAVGYTGNEVFGDTAAGDDIFDLLLRMEDDLRTHDGENLSGIMEELDAHFGRIVNTISNMGVKGNRIEATRNVIADLSIDLKGNKSELQDVDMIEALSKLQQQQTAYEAALSASSKIMSLSLLDYL